MEPYSFVDPYGKEWDVPTGYKTDGASVPAALWALYPPFTGNYRSAAVIHDYYCDNKDTDWQDTHKVFYFAMRAANVDEKTAKIMYGAVYLFGAALGTGHAAGPAQRADQGHGRAAASGGERAARSGRQGQSRSRCLVTEAKRMTAKATAPKAPSSGPGRPGRVVRSATVLGE